MSNRKRKNADMLPEVGQIERELFREKYKKRYKRVLRNTIFTIVIVAAFSVLVATLLLPVLQIYGNSMAPTLREGEIVISVKMRDCKAGDVVAFYYNNHILVKRVIALPGQWVSIDAEGNVYVDNEMLDEPYLTEKSFGESDLEYPYQVPENMLFVLGDHRETSVDSRNSAIGCVDQEEIVGKIIFVLWPFSEFGFIKK